MQINVGLTRFAGLLLLARVWAGDPWSLDFRYAPPNWQTAICLPDDWQKTLVGKDGALLYDYPGEFAGFGTRIAFDVSPGATWVRQELVAPKVPIVRTIKRAGDIEIIEDAFAVTSAPRPAAPGGRSGLAIERVGARTALMDWARPPGAVDPAFRHIAVGYGRPIEYRFRAKPKERFMVVFGLCEGWHTNAAQRVLDLQVEHQTRCTVDLIANGGRNVPSLLACDAADTNGDGWVDLTVAAAPASRDQNTILNVLWVFRGGAAPAFAELLTGQSRRPALAHIDCGASDPSLKPPRCDVLTVRMRNLSEHPVPITPVLTIESGAPVTGHNDRTARLGANARLSSTEPWRRLEATARGARVAFSAEVLGPHAERRLALGVWHGGGDLPDFPRRRSQADAARRTAENYWQRLELPYGRLAVPDPGVQALLDSSIRNIYQAREIKNGLPAFQVGPTCYRGLWVVDGSFLLEAVTYLGRTNETRAGVQYLMSFQRPDGGFMLIDGHWKETGIALWAISRHAQLTGDRQWLRSVWPKVQHGFAQIQALRQVPPADAPNAGLVPDGFSDGGLAEQLPEYTNIYWTMAGMRAAIAAAQWLGNTADAAAWQHEYDDFEATFRRAAQRDTRVDPSGNRYVPIRMAKGQGIPPQKAQWAFCHAVFPGKVFAADDPLLRGNLAMLSAVEREGLVFDTGWLKDGIWNYFGSFYGHAWLWLGDGQKAARTLYAFGNHASPLLCWREEQMPVGQGTAVVGDMPHNWASAEFIRLTRHALVLERGDELHLFEGFPAAWARPGAVTRVREVLTSFGPLSLEFTAAPDGRSGTLRLTPPRRHPPQRIVWHLDGWSGERGTMELPGRAASTQRVRLAGATF